MMHTRMFFLLVIGIFSITAATVSAQDNPCASVGPGLRPATADDAVVKNGQIKVGTCYDPNGQYIGVSTEVAKQYLSTILCAPDNDNYGGTGPVGTIQGLDSKFAVCAAAFLKSANQQRRVCIREGARTVAKQNEYVARGVIACTKGAGCEHPRGVAIDVNVVGAKDQCESYKWIHQMAPQYGLIFYLGCKDAVHFVAQKGGCSSGGNVPAAGNMSANSYDFPSEYAQASQSAPQTSWPNNVSAMNSAFGNAGGNTSAQTQPTCTPQYTCSGSTLYYQTSSCTTQTVQTCANGCAGTQCAVTSASSTNLLSPYTDLLNASQISTSTANSFQTLLGPVSDLLTQTQPVSLNGNLASSNNNMTGQSSTSIAHAVPISGRYASSSETFGSSSNGSKLLNSFSAPASNTLAVIKIVLSTIKLALTSMLHYLLAGGK